MFVNLGDDCVVVGSVVLFGVIVEKRYFWWDWYYGILWVGVMGYDSGVVGGGCCVV